MCARALCVCARACALGLSLSISLSISLSVSLSISLSLAVGSEQLLGLVSFNGSTNNNIHFATPAPQSPHDYLGWVGVNEDPMADAAHRFISTSGTPSWLRAGLPKACMSPGGRWKDTLFVWFSSDGLTFQPPQTSECWLTSKDDTQNIVVWIANKTLVFNRKDELSSPSPWCTADTATAAPQRKISVAAFSTLLAPPEPGRWPQRHTTLTFDATDPPCLDLYASAAVRYEQTVLAFPVAFQHSPSEGVYPNGQCAY